MRAAIEMVLGALIIAAVWAGYYNRIRADECESALAEERLGQWHEYQVDVDPVTGEIWAGRVRSVEAGEQEDDERVTLAPN